MKSIQPKLGFLIKGPTPSQISRTVWASIHTDCPSLSLFHCLTFHNVKNQVIKMHNREGHLAASLILGGSLPHGNPGDGGGSDGHHAGVAVLVSWGH